jgi:hypothetical protein
MNMSSTHITRHINAPRAVVYRALLGLTDGASDHTKARYGFVYGDFHRVHRKGIIACQYRAAEWRHKEVELAAHELLQRLDNMRA